MTPEALVENMAARIHLLSEDVVCIKSILRYSSWKEREDSSDKEKEAEEKERFSRFLDRCENIVKNWPEDFKKKLSG